jgi:putative methyltransferase
LNHPLALLLLHDHLLTRNGIATSSGPLKNAVLKHKARLSAEFTRARLRRGFASVAALREAADAEAAAKIPRWVRVNTLRTTLAEVLKEGFDGYTEVKELGQLLGTTGKERVFYRDPIVKDLLAFPPGVDLTTTELYKDGKLILQDRSSCLPAHLLNPPRNANTIDATAAPGNKTTHIAALLNGGKVTAFEKDPRRAEVLKKMVARAGGDGVISIKAGEDFLKADPRGKGLREVTHLLLDPSCSGSGIVSREEYTLLPLAEPEQKGGKKRKRPVKEKPTKVVVEEDAEQEESKKEVEKSRLLALAEFQKGMILHAMKFPKARKITYSTCSVHAEENEDVVVGVLASAVARKRGWRVEMREEGTLKEWHRRGMVERCGGDEVVAQACVRCNPIEDGGIGFFVVAFVRDGSVDEEKGDAEEGSKVEAVERQEEQKEEWNGFSDDDGEMEAAEKPKVEASGEGKKKKKKRQKRK